MNCITHTYMQDVFVYNIQFQTSSIVHTCLALYNIKSTFSDIHLPYCYTSYNIYNNNVGIDIKILEIFFNLRITYGPDCI